MAFSHLINCILLAFGPYVVSYRAKGLSEYGAFRVLLYTALAYFLTQACKIVIMASFISSTDEPTDFSLVYELNKYLFNMIDVVGIYYALKNNKTALDKHRALAVAIGWSLCENIMYNLFYLLFNASGDEFTWRYMVRAATCNFDLLEVFCVVSLMLSVVRNVKKEAFGFSSFVAIALAGVKSVAIPIVLRSYLQHTGKITEENETYVIAKAVLSVGLFFGTKIIGAA